MTEVYDQNNIFAKILRGEIPCQKVYEDAYVLAFMDIMPRCDGHTLVIPKVPARNILDIPSTDLGNLMQGVQKIARGVVKAFGADGLTIQQFSEPAGGQVVFHLHFHVMPRWNDIPLRPHTGEMAPKETLIAHAAKIRAVLEPA